MDLRNNQITVREILSNPKAKELVNRELPGILDNPMFKMIPNLSLESLLKYSGGIIPQSKINQIINELKKI